MPEALKEDLRWHIERDLACRLKYEIQDQYLKDDYQTFDTCTDVEMTYCDQDGGGGASVIWNQNSKNLIKQLMCVTSISKDLGISMNVINHEVLPFVSKPFRIGIDNYMAWIDSGYPQEI